MRALATGTAAGVFSLSIWVVAAVACGTPPRPSSPISRHASVDAGIASDAAPAEHDADLVSDEPISAAPTLGAARETAIEVCLPRGELAYLARLRCPGDVAASYRRVGLDGYRHARGGEEDYRLSAEQVRTRRPLAPGERDLHPVDLYAVTCPQAAARRLYFDMYHCADGEQAAEAPEGFALAPPAPAAPSPKR